MSERGGCSSADRASLSACAGCRSAPHMRRTWIGDISATFCAINVMPMISSVFVFISSGCTYPFTTDVAIGSARICRYPQQHQHHAHSEQGGQNSSLHIVPSLKNKSEFG